ncbi:MAG TPA: hypothetical protein VEI97_06180 [bacterium]|nr:hypothetical protein [bacterium]
MNPELNVHDFLARRGEALATHIRQRGLDPAEISPGALRHCVRSLDGLSLALDQDVPGLPRPEVDEKKMTAKFVISAVSKDRMGDVVIPRGCLGLLERNYSRNPRVFLSHRKNELPLGSARKEDGSLDVQVHDSLITSTCHFHGQTDESNVVFHLVAARELETASIGFLPVKAAIMQVSKESERAETNEEGEDLIYFADGAAWFPCLRFHEWELTEWSIVPVPANADCVAMHLSRGKVAGLPIPDSLKKAWEPYKHVRKMWDVGAVLERVLPGAPTPVVTPADPWQQLCDYTRSQPEGTTLVITRTADGWALEGTPQGKKDLSDLIPPPSQEAPKPMAPPVEVEEDPTASWTLGAKLLRDCLTKAEAWQASIENQSKQVEQGRVKKYAQRQSSRLEKTRTKTQQLAHQLYPDWFAKPDQKALEGLQEAKSLPEAAPPVVEPIVPPEAPQAPPDWSIVLASLKDLAEGQARLEESHFELTGRRVK